MTEAQLPLPSGGMDVTSLSGLTVGEALELLADSPSTGDGLEVACACAMGTHPVSGISYRNGRVVLFATWAGPDSVTHRERTDLRRLDELMNQYFSDYYYLDLHNCSDRLRWVRVAWWRRAAARVAYPAVVFLLLGWLAWLGWLV